MSPLQGSDLIFNHPGLQAWAIRLWSFRPNNAPKIDAYKPLNCGETTIVGVQSIRPRRPDYLLFCLGQNWL
jgi:hypothetical protein